MRNCLLSSVTLISLLAAAPVFAQSASETVIVTGFGFSDGFGEKSGIPIEKMPQSVQVVTDREIVAQGATSIGDLLRNVPSANAGQSRIAAYQSFSLRIRGFLADQMRNGIRQRYYEDVDASALSNIDRVEVLKGPSGVLYGHSAVGGIVSIITKRPQEKSASSFALTLGNYGQKMVSADITGGIAPGLSMRLTGEVERSDTFVDYQDMDRVNGAFSLRYVPTDYLALNVVTEYVERKTRRYPGLPVKGTVESNGGTMLPRGLYLGEPSVDDMNAHAPLVQSWLDVRLSEDWTLTPRLQYQEFNTDFTQIRLRAPQASLTVIDRNGRTGREDDEYYISQLDISGAFKTGAIGHKLLAGYEYGVERGRFTQYDLTNVGSINVRSPVYAYATIAPARTFSYDIQYANYTHALYLQDQVSLTDRWDVVGSARQSWIATTDRDFGSTSAIHNNVDATIWSLGTTYQLGDAFSLYGGYSTGFDIEGTAGVRSANGQPLKPEESNQTEVGMRLRLPDLTGSVALFQIERANALTTDSLNPNFSLNVGEQRVQGFEIEGAWQAASWLNISGGYAYLDSEITRSNDGDQGKRVGDVPAHSLRIGAEVAIPSTDLTLRGGLNHVSNRLLVNGSNTRLSGYTIASLGATYQFDRVSMNLSVNNLFDETYYAASGNAFAVIPGDPRMVSLRVGFDL